MSQVSLTSYEMLQAATIGMTRQVAALQSELKDQHGMDGPGWNVHIEPWGPQRGLLRPALGPASAGGGMNVSISHWGVFSIELGNMPLEQRFVLLRQRRLLPINEFENWGGATDVAVANQVDSK